MCSPKMNLLDMYSGMISTVITEYDGSMDASVTHQGGSYDHQSQPQRNVR